MLFYVKTIARDRLGGSFKDPKPGAEPADGRNFGKDQLQDATYGSVALRALDMSLQSDQKEASSDLVKWVKLVKRREDIADRIQNAFLADGWAEIPDDWRDLLVDRLAELALQQSNALVGPIIRILTHPPKEKANVDEIGGVNEQLDHPPGLRSVR